MAHDRKEIVLTVRLEGAKSAADGKHLSTCPYQDMNAFQWAQGFTAFQNTVEDNERWGTVEDHQFALDAYIEKRQYYTNKFREGL